MKTSSKITIVFFFTAIITIAYFAFPVISERYFAEENETEQTSPQEETEATEEDSNSEPNEENANDEDEIDEEKEAEEFAKEDAFLEIGRSDCENGCVGFDDQEDTDYCKQICGLVPLSKPSGEEDCSKFEDLEKDYCFKDLAIEKTDAGICGKIEDKNIRSACEKRIMEDIVDKQMEGRNTNSL